MDKFRISAFSQAQPVFETYLELLIKTGASPEKSFEIAERARSRYLLDFRASRLNPSEEIPITPISASDLQRLPPDCSLIMFTVLRDRLLVWHATRNRLELKTVDVAQRALENKVARLRNSITRRAAQQVIDKDALSLAGDLLLPFAAELNLAQRPFIVPDRFLQRVPYLALPNPTTNRLLIEDLAISVVPSASTLLFCPLPAKPPPHPETTRPL